MAASPKLLGPVPAAKRRKRNRRSYLDRLERRRRLRRAASLWGEVV